MVHKYRIGQVKSDAPAISDDDVIIPIIPIPVPVGGEGKGTELPPSNDKTNGNTSNQDTPDGTALVKEQLKAMDFEQLVKFGKEHEIDLGQTTTQSGAYKKIVAALAKDQENTAPSTVAQQ